MVKSLKVLHLPTSVGGNSWGLAQGERGLGINADVLIERRNWLNYGGDICLNLQNVNKIRNILIRWKTFFKIRQSYDVFHFNSGCSLFDFGSHGVHLWDLPYYPKGKKIFFTFNGCDARQRLNTILRVPFSACHEKECYHGLCSTNALDIVKKKRIEKVAKYARHIFSVNPDLLHVLPESASFLPYTIAGWSDILPLDYTIGKTFRIIHSPTDKGAKGSAYIIQALDKIKKKYKNIETILVENIPNAAALKIYAQADLVIDQVLIGWYGAFGVEVMKMGKPLAVFIRKEDLKFIPEQMADDLCKAIININPSNICDVIEEYITNPHLLRQKSEAGQEYVYRWHDPAYVAAITKSYYEA